MRTMILMGLILMNAACAKTPGAKEVTPDEACQAVLSGHSDLYEDSSGARYGLVDGQLVKLTSQCRKQTVLEGIYPQPL